MLFLHMKGAKIAIPFSTKIEIKCYNKKQLFMKKYYCTVCQWEYDPAIGDPEQGIEPGTSFENLPADWVCPMCGVGKDEFEPVEE